MKVILTTIFATTLSLTTWAQQQDTMFVHTKQSVYEFAVKDVDSVTPKLNTTEDLDSLYVYKTDNTISRFSTVDIDSIVFRPTIPVPKGHLFIHGGIAITAQQGERFIDLAGGPDAKILVIPFGDANQEGTGSTWTQRFRNFGATHVEHIVFEKGEADLEENLEKLNGVTGIWFSGNTPRRLMEMLHGTAFLERIKEIYWEGGAIGGISAGAAVMNKIMFTGEEAVGTHAVENYPLITKDGIAPVAGFGFVDFAIIDNRFLHLRRQNRLTNMVIDLHLPGIGIDDSTAIIFSEGNRTFEVFGYRSVVVFEPRFQELPRVDEFRNLSADVIDIKIFLGGDHYAVRHHNLVGIISGPSRNPCPDQTAVLSIKGVESSSFQWYKDETPIPGANSNTYIATESGTYEVSFGAGTMSFPKDVTIVPCLTYEDFLGTYTLYYSTSSAEPIGTRTMTVSLEQAVHGRSYHLIGVLQDEDQALANIEVLYNAQKGIEIPGNRRLFIRSGNVHFYMMTVRTDGSNQRLTMPNAGLVGTNYRIINGKLNFDTMCRGIGTNAQGFIFRNFPDNENVNTINVNHKGGSHMLYYPRFVKQ